MHLPIAPAVQASSKLPGPPAPNRPSADEKRPATGIACRLPSGASSHSGPPEPAGPPTRGPVLPYRPPRPARPLDRVTVQPDHIGRGDIAALVVGVALDAVEP